MRKLLVISILVMLVGCQTKDIDYSKITKKENGDVITEKYKDKTYGFVNWSDGAGKKMPFSEITISGLNVGK